MRYPKEVVLKEGKEAVIRPLEKQDEGLLGQFYAELPDSDRWFMRYDVLDSKVVRKWIDGVLISPFPKYPNLADIKKGKSV